MHESNQIIRHNKFVTLVSICSFRSNKNMGVLKNLILTFSIPIELSGQKDFAVLFSYSIKSPLGNLGVSTVGTELFFP